MSELKKYRKALTCYNKAIETNPSDFVLYVERGDVFSQLKRYREVVAAMIKLLKLHAWIYNNRGLAYKD